VSESEVIEGEGEMNDIYAWFIFDMITPLLFYIPSIHPQFASVISP